MKINRAYKDYLETTERVNVFYGGAGSGKSKFVVQKMVLKLLKDTRKMLVVRKVQATIKESIFTEFKTVLSDANILKLCEINKTDLSILFPNGSRVIFKGMDDKEKIKSISGIDDIVIEEATELTLDDYTQLNLRLRSNKDNLQIHLMFNPVSKANWVYKHFFENELKDTLVVKTTYKDNKFLPKEYIESILALKETNPTYYKIYVEGDFATLDKLIYPYYQVADFELKDILKEGGKAYFGLDFGYVNDPTAFIGVALNEAKREIYIFDEFYKQGMLNNEIAEMIIYKNYQKEIITGDSAEQKSIEEIRRLGVSRIRGAKKGKDSVINGIQKINQYKLFVHSSCINTKIELDNYTWKKDKNSNEYLNVPTDNFNHLLDALRYALENVGKDKIKIISKNKLF